MTQQLSERVVEMIEQAGNHYHRLVLVVGAAGAGKTNALREAATHAAAPLVNVNLEISRHLLDLTERQRARRTQPLLRRIAAASGSDIGNVTNYVSEGTDSLLFVFVDEDQDAVHRGAVLENAHRARPDLPSLDSVLTCLR